MEDSGGKKYIITGGPGAGKTSLLHALNAKGYNISPEVSRQLIAEGVAKGSTCLPWIDLSCFAEKTLQRMAALYRQAAPHSGTTFFDRGIPDVFAYLKVAGLPVKEEHLQLLQAHPYQTTVFILPPWKDIFVNDPERWQTFEEATVLYTALKETYSSLGYTLIEVPGGTIEERSRFLLRHTTTKYSSPTC